MIRLEKVSKRYQMGEVCVTALDNVSVEIGKGEFVVVLGPSGSGKTHSSILSARWMCPLRERCISTVVTYH